MAVDHALPASLPPNLTPTEQLYARLAAPFAVLHHDSRGGATFDYVTGEQVVTRLNSVLGPLGWSFVVRSHGLNAEADEIWVQGELTVTLDGVSVSRAQFGSQKVKRARQTGNVLDIGFDLKGATTDALKKCASLVGVGLDLTRKEPPPADPAAPDGPTPEMWALVGGGFVEPPPDRWAPFWSAVLDTLHLSWAETRALLGDPADPVDYLRALRTNIENLYRLLKLHVETGRPLPQSLPARAPSQGR